MPFAGLTKVVEQVSRRVGLDQPPIPTPRRWDSISGLALSALSAHDLHAEGASTIAFAYGATGLVFGWDAQENGALLAILQQKRNPDGGFGLNREYDAFATGESNPPDTTYAITTAGHVGRVLLDAAAAGAVPPAEIRGLAEVLLGLPRCGGEPGACVGYSTIARDSLRCVHNVNASVGWFLHRAVREHSADQEAADLAAAIGVRTAAAYDEDVGGWSYAEGGTRRNDVNHEAGTVEGMLLLDPPLGRRALSRLMRRRDYGSPRDPIGQIRLLPHSRGSHEEFALEAARQIGLNRSRPAILAQIAYWVARIGSGS